MCGRYRLSRRKQEIKDYFETNGEVDWEPRYNIAPTQQVGIIRHRAGRRDFSLVRWGLIPSWAKSPAAIQSTFNARSETALDKPAFADSLHYRRCLIPADGFYEWRRATKSKQPFHFGMHDASLFAFAGLWDRWIGADLQTIESCSILTTAANSVVSEVHDRMPVILGPDRYSMWLEPGLTDSAALTSLLTPFEPTLMKSYTVGARVNSAAHDDAQCAEPEIPQQAMLF